MVGYPESLTDPSYSGQILVLTFPLIGNYGVPDFNQLDEYSLLKYFESEKIHISGLVVGIYSKDYSHHLASSSLGAWLKDNGIPGIFGVDTRALTVKIRNSGSQLVKILTGKIPNAKILSDFNDVEWNDPNSCHLVESVSRKKVQTFMAKNPLLNSKTNKPIIVLAVDLGMKNNQIRCFLKRGISLKVVPHDYDFTKENYDGLFLSNGPGDPEMCTETIKNLKKQLELGNKPIFGICLGHQILAIASGASTKKLLFGNRGQNIPCTDLETGRCYITSQNHGFAVDVDTLANGWKEYFVNANDGSNEGIIHTFLPYFSVQFHPESSPGPWDTEYLFDKFSSVIQKCVQMGTMVPFEPLALVIKSLSDKLEL
jgi:carbamoyl-phosphate synthase/aspartate carbamoyltransferase